MAIFPELGLPRLSLAVAAAFVVAAVLIPLLRRPARRLGLVDQPDHRKQHRDPTPMTGGVALAAGLVAGLLVAFGLDWGPFWSLPAGAFVLLLLGLVDDVRPLSAVLRLLVQLAVATALVVSTDVHLHLLGPLLGPAVGPIGLGPVSGLFTILCVAFMINAINMTDGLDGLAGGLVLVVLLLMALVAGMDGAPAGLVALPALLAAALSGFLLHNVRSPLLQRARAFLGDSGSMMLGYVLAWLAITLVVREGSGVTPITVAWLLAIPAMDTLALFCRRILQGRSPFSPDRTHLHHILRRAGQPVSMAVHLIQFAVLATGLFGILGWQLGWPQWLMFALLAGMMLTYTAALINAATLLRAVGRTRRRRQGNAPDGARRARRDINMNRSRGHIGPRSGGGRK